MIFYLFSGPILWSMWENLYRWSCHEAISIAHQLTNDHIHLTTSLKMRNHLAEQVLNSDILAAFKVGRLLPSESMTFSYKYDSFESSVISVQSYLYLLSVKLHLKLK